MDKKECITEMSVPLINWEIVGDAMEKLTWTKRKWTPKHISENCGTGKTLHKWNAQQDALCPRCHEREEDAQHLKIIFLITMVKVS